MDTLLHRIFLLTSVVVVLFTSSVAKPSFGNDHFCVPPAPPVDGKVSLGRGDVVVRFSCNAGFKLVGTPVAVCIAGKWSSRKPQCRPKDKPAFEQTGNNNSSSSSDLVQKDQQIVSVFNEYDLKEPVITAGKNKETRMREKEERRRERKGRRKNGRREKKRREKNKNKDADKGNEVVEKETKTTQITKEDDVSKNDKKRIDNNKEEKRRRKNKLKKGKGDRRGRKRSRKGKKILPVEDNFKLENENSKSPKINHIVTKTPIDRGEKNIRRIGRKRDRTKKKYPNRKTLIGNDNEMEDNSILFPLGRKNNRRKSSRKKNKILFENIKERTIQQTTERTTSSSPTSTLRIHNVADSIYSDYSKHNSETTTLVGSSVNPSTTTKATSTTKLSVPKTSVQPTLSPVSIQKNKNFLQDIIKKIKNPEKLSSNLLDVLLVNQEEKESDNKLPPYESKKEKNDVKTIKEHDKINMEKNQIDLENDLKLAENDYDNNISAYDEEDYATFPEGYPDIYKNEFIEENRNKTTISESDYSPFGANETEEGLIEKKEGYPSPEKRLYDEDEVKAAKERFIEEENIDFSILDSTCIISELDSVYVPPPRVEHGHVTAYTTVTNPSRPNNVYVEAVYECDFGHQLQEVTSNRLFCRENKWMGILPECVAYDTGDGICGSGNGRCEQLCHMKEEEMICSCYRGFTLNEDGRSCGDIDECATENGGCEGACFNKLGSHQCYCPKGYRLATNGKACVDKNECILRNGHGPCQDTCYNTEGGYYCSCESIPGTKLGSDNHMCEDVDECALNNGGCSHICLNTFGQTFCACPVGFILDMDWKTCKDINECDYPEIAKECSHGCVNNPGSYHCADMQLEFVQKLDCSQGLSPSEDGKSCEDIDECDDEGFGCSHTCANTYGSAHCECPSGYVLGEDSKTCQDLDECIPSSPCSHKCINNEGSFACDCPPGMNLGPDLLSCVDINECATDNGGCNHLCQNDIGSFRCDCKHGFSLSSDGITCVDTDECLINNGGCDQICFNSEGDFNCSCLVGYELEDDMHCSDIDECTLQEADCDHECQNTVGSYECLCHDGFELHADNSSCTDIDECGDENECSHFCSNQDGSYVCKCPPGWKLSKDKHTCRDINECKKDNGGCSHSCKNIDGGYKCSCPKGMQLITEGTTFEKKHLCIDIDECEENNGNCSHLCENIEGSYICKCADGFKSNVSSNSTQDQETCGDVNECLEDNGGCSHTCVNMEGAFECQCPKGLKLHSDGLTCNDINECLKNNGGCSHDCVNLAGTYECTCPAGWDIDYSYDYDNEATYLEGVVEPWKTCVDIDECERSGNSCSHECVNEKGGFFCKCPSGYLLVDEFNCQDVDECIVDKGGCSHSCTNLEGSFLCHCLDGFQLIDSTRCIDIDECSTQNGNCTHFCINEIGGYRCSCPEGFLLEENNLTCTDFNECGDFNGGCSHECQNFDGKYTCSCPPGMNLITNEHDCEDINECDTLNGLCSHRCINEQGSYSCSCPSGLTLAVDKKNCLDVDECGLNNGGCSHQCSNQEGHYVCLCPPGTILQFDSHTCVDVDECNTKNGGCSYNCINTDGGYSCGCPLGMELGKDNHICHDVDECLAENGGCSGQCHNTRGSFRCDCQQGFSLSGDGYTCEDLNECRLANGGCSHKCVNTQGSFICECPTGYILSEDKYRCIDVDECQGNPCEHECLNTPGSFYCKCKDGFMPRPDSAHRCWDINECEKEKAGCAQECFNTIGSYFCSCADGFILESDKHSCEQKPVFCAILVAPPGGQMRCSKDLQGDTYPRGTVCDFRCSDGASLHGATNTTCTEHGSWTSDSVSCQAIRCPALSEVEHGIVAPSRCVRGTSTVGNHCYLTCSQGYRVIGNPVRTCTASGSWSPEATSPFCEKDTIKPFIQCPGDVTVDLAPHQNSAYVRLPKPKSNVDWFRTSLTEWELDEERNEEDVEPRFIDSSPEWAKDLEDDFPAGRTTITFRAHSPLADTVASCSFVVFVIDTENPQVFGCPKPFNVHLNPSESSTEVTWNEPVFKDNVEVSHIYKSMEPGRKLTAGTYPVHYVAVDPQRNRAKCSFVITVEVAPPVQRLFQSNQVWVVCPGLNGGRAIQMHVWRVPQGCTVVHPSNSALHAPWEHTPIHSEVHSANNVAAEGLPPRPEPTQGASAYDDPLVSQGYSQSIPNPGDMDSSASATAFAVKQRSGNAIGGGEDNNSGTNHHRTRHQHSFHSFYGDSNPFSQLLQGSQTFALAHARAGSGINGELGSSAFAHAQTNDENIQALAHARARTFNYG